MTMAQAYELRRYQASAVAVTPGWMRSEDMHGTQPDCWRYLVEVQDKNLPAGDHGYR